MSKSYKIKDGNYLDSSSIVHNKKQLSEILNELGDYTTAEGQYTTGSWSEGTNNCIWTAPKTGIYIIWGYFIADSDDSMKVYKQLQLRGTATRLLSSIALYQAGASSASADNTWSKVGAGTFSMPVYAQQGQTIIPYIHTPVAGLKWNVKIVGMFIK